jgi:glycosyltransferase involved in cell wall biosynthesis
VKTKNSNVRADPKTALKIAMIGTRGVPAQYGGFETCVEEVGRRLAANGHRVVVYCRSAGGENPRPASHLGMELVHLPALRRRTLETLSHTGLSAMHAVGAGFDAAIVFNAANSPWLPVIRAAGVPVATHVDGLEWKRAKWGPSGKKYYRFAESLAVRWSDALIADAAGIQEYYRTEFAAETQLITYGAPILPTGRAHRLAELQLEPKKYHLVVARFEPENHVHTIVEGFTASHTTLPLVVVGSAPYSDTYTREILRLGDQRVRFLGGVWDQELLDQLYGNAAVYWHGHSVGGTNPSLLRAIGAGAATNAFDVNFNREVLGDAGLYFSSPAQVARLVADAEINPAATAGRGQEARVRAALYDWDKVTDRYEALCEGLAAGIFKGTANGRRMHHDMVPGPRRASGQQVAR